ncbi:uncharacterized protein N7511_003252 [Penicillium nucicola]|uniref:uncharacterized protein n=1 Tax=Penicillium nucicola TaxID=1850975 RepID=UPI002544DEFC|nr:uncharacterized protein N7511_003252 [Penicillium nucicola]KAJ5771201.1 hypothetical protein N7511_003252 [Penicillium nucicola]
MDDWSDQGPPRKRMRKGTKSCTECRRRKIRCTFHPDRPGVCNECRSRGTQCIDQEHTVITPPLSGSQFSQGEQPYSLRERVAHLEHLVEGLTKRLDRQNSRTPSTERHESTQPTTCPSMKKKCPLETTSSDELGPSSDQIRNAPVLQLFDNYLVSRREDTSDNDKFAGVKDMSPKAHAVRTELLSILPPTSDVNKIINASFHWFEWQDHFPELFNRADRRLLVGEDCHKTLVAPAEVAKALMCLCISAIHAPDEFDFQALTEPLDPQVFYDRCVTAVDRLIVRDDDFAATLPGIECQMLLSKLHLAEGRLRKAWLVNRRAIEFAHLAGMHLSTKVPRPEDSLYERRLKIWCSLGTSDRSLSLILGLPYGVAECFFLPQVKQRLNSNITAPEGYLLRIGVITGHMVDRIQDPSNMSFEATMKLDEELQDSWNAMPIHLRSENPSLGERREHYLERVPLQFMLKLLRALLHLPLMLQAPHKPQFRPCHKIAIDSAREGLSLYKVLRSTTKPYLCKMTDFMAFTLCMLLIVHLHGYSDESPDHSTEQDQKDWGLVENVVGILRRAATEPGGSVAVESANILGAIFDNRELRPDCCNMSSCKITVPYFGTITVGAGTKFSKCAAKCAPKLKDLESTISNTAEAQASCPGQNSCLPYTPPISDPEGPSTTNTEVLNGDTLTPSLGPGYPDESWLSRGEPPTNPFAGLEVNAFSGLFDDFGQYMWPNPSVDLGLDQGWNLNWYDAVPP